MIDQGNLLGQMVFAVLGRDSSQDAPSGLHVLVATSSVPGNISSVSVSVFNISYTDIPPSLSLLLFVHGVVSPSK